MTLLDNLNSVIFKKLTPETFDNLTITSLTSRVRTAAVVHSFNFPEVKSEAYRDFPGGTEDKTPHSQCRGPGFDPCSGN